jgi:hypothetical protein
MLRVLAEADARVVPRVRKRRVAAEREGAEVEAVERRSGVG